METKVVKITISKYQRCKLREVTGCSNIRASIERLMLSDYEFETFVDKTERKGVPVRLPLDIIYNLHNGHKNVSDGLMRRMNIIRDSPQDGGNFMILTDSQREILHLLGKGSVEEGLRCLIGE